MPTPVFGVAAGGDVCAALLLGAGVVGMLSGGLGVGDVLDGTKGVAIVLEGAGVGTALEGAGVAVMLGGAGVAVTMLEGAGAEVIEGAKVDAVGVAARLNGTEGCSNGGGLSCHIVRPSFLTATARLFSLAARFSFVTSTRLSLFIDKTVKPKRWT